MAKSDTMRNIERILEEIRSIEAFTPPGQTPPPASVGGLTERVGYPHVPAAVTPPRPPQVPAMGRTGVSAPATPAAAPTRGVDWHEEVRRNQELYQQRQRQRQADELYDRLFELIRRMGPKEREELAEIELKPTTPEAPAAPVKRQEPEPTPVTAPPTPVEPEAPASPRETLGPMPTPVPGTGPQNVREQGVFGARRRSTTRGVYGHEGLDIYADEGTPIRTPIEGVVDAYGKDDHSGYWVRVLLPGARRDYMFFAHLQKHPEGWGGQAMFGEPIKQGDLIGYVGRTGNVPDYDDPHLHLGIRYAGQWVDPMAFFPELAGIGR